MANVWVLALITVLAALLWTGLEAESYSFELNVGSMVAERLDEQADSDKVSAV